MVSILAMGCDRISELPDCLLSQILLDLPTRDSVKTSVLSKRWQFLWPMVPGLDLKASDFPHSRDVLEKFMDKFLEFSHKSRMQKVKIRYDKYNISSYRMVEWIGIWADRGIQHLDIEFQTYTNMPHNIYKSKTLVSLKLTHVGLNDPKFVVSLPCLKIMHLEDICYNGNNPFFMERFVSGCPVLEDLTLIEISNGYYLRFMFCLRERSQTSYFEIDAPQVKYMKLRDYKSDMILVKNFSSLVMIDIDTDFSPKHRDPLRPTKRDIISGFLTGISSVKHMIISQRTLELIFLYSKPIPKFDNLYRLQAVFSSSMIQLLPIFLESCPNLKDFILSFAVSTKPNQTDLTYVPQCLLSTLECVEIKELLIKEKTWKRLAKYFLENSVVLKKLTLCFKDYSIANQDSDIFEELCKFTKHSRECQIMIH